MLIEPSDLHFYKCWMPFWKSICQLGKSGPDPKYSLPLYFCCQTCRFYLLHTLLKQKYTLNNIMDSFICNFWA